MSGVEILAALAVIAAAADTVTKVVDALHTTKDFIESFSNKNDYSRELENLIDQAKKSIQAEIQAVELQDYMNTINGAALWYYKCQKTIQAYGISNHTVKDPDGELHLFSQSILDTIMPLDNMKLWVESDTRPRPRTAKMLGVYLAYYAIRHSLLVTYEAFEFTRTGHNSATIGDLVQSLQDSQRVLNQRFKEYQSVRASQLVLRRVNPGGGEPPGSGYVQVISDNGGDTLVPNIPVGTQFYYSRLDPPKDAGLIIREKWGSTEFGRTTIPNLFKAYDGAYKSGLSLLSPRQLRRIVVIEHFIPGGQI